MTDLVLVRHGQASFGSPDYDRLSEPGVRQSQRLGAWWRQTGTGFDLAYHGAMRRHVDTARHAFAAAGPMPPPREQATFNEYDAGGVIAAYRDRVLERQPDLAPKNGDLITDRRAFQRFFSAVIALWLNGAPPARDGLEGWTDFRTRAVEGLRDIVSPGARRRVVVFTSGGIITAALQHALDLAPAAAFTLNWRIYNASLHRFRWSRSGLVLTGFNDVAHLASGEDPALLTFR